jgi:toxin ParE1/3/4
MEIILSPAAILDLQSISGYTRQTWGIEQEEFYLKGLWKKLEEIQLSPGSYRLRDDLLQGCRSARHEKHVIFFALQGQTLQIIRILHGAMDFRIHLASEELPDG